MKRKKINVVKTVNQAIRFAQSHPCHLCSLQDPEEHRCIAGVKYKGTCKVFIALKCELLKMREMSTE